MYLLYHYVTICMVKKKIFFNTKRLATTSLPSVVFNKPTLPEITPGWAESDKGLPQKNLVIAGARFLTSQMPIPSPSG